MFILRQTSVKMAVLLHKQAKVPFILIIAVYPWNSKELWDTLRNSGELQETPRNSEELRGTPRNSEELLETPRNS